MKNCFAFRYLHFQIISTLVISVHLLESNQQWRRNMLQNYSLSWLSSPNLYHYLYPLQPVTPNANQMFLLFLFLLTFTAAKYLTNSFTLFKMVTLGWCLDLTWLPTYWPKSFSRWKIWKSCWQKTILKTNLSQILSKSLFQHLLSILEPLLYHCKYRYHVLDSWTWLKWLSLLLAIYNKCISK